LASLPSILPEVGLVILAVVVLFLDVYLPESQRRTIAYVTAIGLALLAIVPLIWQPPAPGSVGAAENLLYWGGMVRHDVLSQIFKVMILLAGALAALMAVDMKSLGRRGEYYLIIVVATLGAT